MQNRPITLADLTQDLLWPRLLRVPILALAPGRMTLSVLGVVLIALSLRLPRAWGDHHWDWVTADSGVRTGEWGLQGWFAAAVAWVTALVESPGRLLHQPFFSAVLPAIPALAIFGVLSGAVARSAGIEAASGIRPDTGSSLVFAVRRWASLAGSILVPLFLVLLLTLTLAIGGWALLGVAYVKIVAAVVYPVALLLGLLAVLLLLGFALGWPMLAPAVMCEGSDGLDSVQRVYAYVKEKPLRLAVYLCILGAMLWLSAGVLNFVIEQTVHLTGGAAGAWLGETSRGVIAGDSKAGTSQSFSDRTAGSVVGFWVAVMRLGVAAYVFSFVACGGSVLYLIMRRLTDGQDISEVWTDGTPIEVPLDAPGAPQS